ncbi:unnamed protein product [Protopolystoma xenopodis]|uniref:Uncharacterized protein n=1 Tax=Protopolystoma xenopodis TaxID=117903 RepID=A0A448WNF1_9PLAT|nr:unnamed protein product [Protopolystoma xenopodis]
MKPSTLLNIQREAASLLTNLTSTSVTSRPTTIRRDQLTKPKLTTYMPRNRIVPEAQSNMPLARQNLSQYSAGRLLSGGTAKAPVLHMPHLPRLHADQEARNEVVAPVTMMETTRKSGSIMRINDLLVEPEVNIKLCSYRCLHACLDE